MTPPDQGALKPCPCGEVPERLLLEDQDLKWGRAFGSCCNAWMIEFRTQYMPEYDDVYEFAVQAWNDSPRPTENNDD